MTKSDAYAAAQTLLLILFAVVFFLFPGPLLFVSTAALRVGTVVCAGALLLLIVSLITLRRVIRVAPAPKDGGQLITSGVYRIVRHPMYNAMTLLLTGLWLRRPTLAVGVLAAAAIVFFVVKSRYEETLLVAAYPEYAAYRLRTRGVLFLR